MRSSFVTCLETWLAGLFSDGCACDWLITGFDPFWHKFTRLTGSAPQISKILRLLIDWSIKFREEKVAMADNGNKSPQKRPRHEDEDNNQNRRELLDVEGINIFSWIVVDIRRWRRGPNAGRWRSKEETKKYHNLPIPSNTSPPPRESLSRPSTLQHALHQIIHASRLIDIRSSNSAHRLHHHHIRRRRNKVLEETGRGNWVCKTISWTFGTRDKCFCQCRWIHVCQCQ